MKKKVEDMTPQEIVNYLSLTVSMSLRSFHDKPNTARNRWKMQHRANRVMNRECLKLWEKGLIVESGHDSNSLVVKTYIPVIDVTLKLKDIQSDGDRGDGDGSGTDKR